MSKFSQKFLNKKNPAIENVDVDNEESGEDVTKAKKVTSPLLAKFKKPVVKKIVEDDEDDSSSDIEDDIEDEVVVPKASKPKKLPKMVDEDEEEVVVPIKKVVKKIVENDEDDSSSDIEDDIENEDEEEVVVPKASKPKKLPKMVDEDDEDDSSSDIEDDIENEDEEEVVVPKASKPKKLPKMVDEDEEEVVTRKKGGFGKKQIVSEKVTKELKPGDWMPLEKFYELAHEKLQEKLGDGAPDHKSTTVIVVKALEELMLEVLQDYDLRWMGEKFTRSVIAERIYAPHSGKLEKVRSDYHTKTSEHTRISLSLTKDKVSTKGTLTSSGTFVEGKFIDGKFVKGKWGEKDSFTASKK